MNALLAFALAVCTAVYPAPTPAIAQCPTEDAPGPCVWIATEQGNGTGQSLIVTSDQTIVYILP